MLPLASSFQRWCLVGVLGLIGQWRSKQITLPSFDMSIAPTLAVGAIAAFTEEIIYRQWLPGMLQSVWNPSPLVLQLVTATVFSVAHLTNLIFFSRRFVAEQMVFTFLLGCALPLFSLMESIQLHLCYNMLVILPHLWTVRSSSSDTPVMEYYPRRRRSYPEVRRERPISFDSRPISPEAMKYHIAFDRFVENAVRPGK